MKAGLKGREHEAGGARVTCLRAGVRDPDKNKPPVFILADRGTGERYVRSARAADESIEEDDKITREYVVHSDGDTLMESLT